MPCLACGSQGTGKRCRCTVLANRKEAAKKTADLNARRAASKTPAIFDTTLPNTLIVSQTTKSRFRYKADKLGLTNDGLLTVLMDTHEKYGALRP